MCVVYKITNLINKKIYVGKDVRNRSLYFGSGKVLKQAIKKYGKENFKKEILEECTKDVLSDREKFWIDLLKSNHHGIGYNLTIGGDGGDTFTNHSDYDKIRINKKRSKSLKGKLSGDKNPSKRKEIRQKISTTLKIGYASGRIKKLRLSRENNANTGKKRTQEQRTRISEALHRPETSRKISIATRNRWQSMSLDDKNQIIKKIVQKNRGQKRTPEQNLQNSQRQILRFSNLENRRKASLSQRKRFQNETKEQKEARIQKLKNFYKNRAI